MTGDRRGFRNTLLRFVVFVSPGDAVVEGADEVNELLTSAVHGPLSEEWTAQIAVPLEHPGQHQLVVDG